MLRFYTHIFYKGYFFFYLFDFFIENIEPNKNGSYLEDLGVKNNLKVKKLVNTYTKQEVHPHDIINYRIEVKAIDSPTYYVKNLT